MKGFDIDIANALCDEMKVKCTLIKQDWDGIIPALLSRKYDAIIATMDITEERKKKVDFTQKYQHIPARFAAKKGTEIQLDKAFMDGKTIAVQRATSMDTYITDNFPNATIKRYGTADEAYLDLKSGRVDYVMADSAAISDGLLKKEGACLRVHRPETDRSQVVWRGCRHRGAQGRQGSEREIQCRHPGPACQWQVQGNQRQVLRLRRVRRVSRRQANNDRLIPSVVIGPVAFRWE